MQNVDKEDCSNTILMLVGIDALSLGSRYVLYMCGKAPHGAVQGGVIPVRVLPYTDMT
jgi:hypothetical protein